MSNQGTIKSKSDPYCSLRAEDRSATLEGEVVPKTGPGLFLHRWFWYVS